MSEKKLFSILIVVDDFADSPAFTRNSKLLWLLYVRGRHFGISVVTSVQRSRVLAPIIRANATALIVFRLRNVKEYEAIAEENSALVSKQRFHEIYEEATSEPYSFLFIDAMAKTLDKTFWVRFEYPMTS